MKIPQCAVVDFETEGIELRPKYPPVPVGVSIQKPGEKRSKYYSWGHPVGNNTTLDIAKRALEEVWKSNWGILCQHAKFDIDVAETHMGMKALSWERVHDTEYLLFLHDPHAQNLSLKPSAHKILGMPPTEQEAVRDWLIGRGIVAKNDKEWGAHICDAPGTLVGEYANGDILRTKKLFEKLYPEICDRGMQRAYDRERRLMPIFLENERIGIRLDVNCMERDLAIYEKALLFADNWLRKQLHAKDLNFDSDKDVGEVLDREGVVTDWVWTKGGKGRAPQRSVSKKLLTIDKFKNQRIALVFAYRNRLTTCLGMFMRPWLELSDNGMLHMNWNQVRQPRGQKFSGTRTGRPSMNDPNFLNVSKNFEDNDDGYVHPKVLRSLPPLPLMRKYLLPDPGEVWGHRDYNQQELRMLAHFEDGDLCARYNREPRFDIHTSVQEGLLQIANIALTRRGTKVVNFADLYGKGLVGLAASLGVDITTAKAIRKAKEALMPGVANLIWNIQQRGRDGKPIRTWGGREYYAEQPAYSKKFKRVMDFFYKLTNYLIQGSSADVTKEALILYDEHPKRESRFLVTVYDEINSSMPKKRLKQEMAILKECMQAVCDPEIYGDRAVGVPMLSDGKNGPNWGTLTKFEDKLENGVFNMVDNSFWLKPILGEAPLA